MWSILSVFLKKRTASPTLVSRAGKEVHPPDRRLRDKLLRFLENLPADATAKQVILNTLILLCKSAGRTRLVIASLILAAGVGWPLFSFYTAFYTALSHKLSEHVVQAVVEWVFPEGTKPETAKTKLPKPDLPKQNPADVPVAVPPSATVPVLGFESSSSHRSHRELECELKFKAMESATGLLTFYVRTRDAYALGAWRIMNTADEKDGMGIVVDRLDTTADRWMVRFMAQDQVLVVRYVVKIVGTPPASGTPFPLEPVDPTKRILFKPIPRPSGSQLYDDTGTHTYLACAVNQCGSGKNAAPAQPGYTQTPTIQTATSDHPEDNVGDARTDTARYLSASQPMNYSIYFGNLQAWTAPAQKVVITDELTSLVDLATLTRGPISFEDNLVTPPGLPLSIVGDHTALVDLGPAKNLIVTLDPASNEFTWLCIPLDPTTMEPPKEPLSGSLPPLADGSASFSESPKTALTGTQITNQATIVFDPSPPLDTPVWLNGIDNSKPSSHVNPLAANQISPTFFVSWTGSDLGSGVQDFTIFVSDNGGPVGVWQQNSTATSSLFSGTIGHAYSFYSIARDLAGNLENLKGVAEVSTVVTDATPPVTVGQVTASLGSNGWNNSNVTVILSVSDPESSVAALSDCGSATLTTDTAGVMLTCSASIPSSMFLTIKLDKTPVLVAAWPDTQLTCDPEDRLTTTLSACGLQTSFAYDAAGNLVSVRDPRGDTTTFTYDSMGRYTSITEALGRRTQFAYDPFRRMTSILSPSDGTRTYTYDQMGNLLAVTGASTAYAYDASDRLLTNTLDPSGTAAFTYTYDARGKLTTLAHIRRLTTFHYEPVADNLLDLLGNAAEWAYDSLATQDAPRSLLRYSYDPTGNRTSSANLSSASAEKAIALGSGTTVTVIGSAGLSYQWYSGGDGSFAGTSASPAVATGYSQLMARFYSAAAGRFTVEPLSVDVADDGGTHLQISGRVISTESSEPFFPEPQPLSVEIANDGGTKLQVTTKIWSRPHFVGSLKRSPTCQIGPCMTTSLEKRCRTRPPIAFDHEISRPSPRSILRLGSAPCRSHRAGWLWLSTITTNSTRHLSQPPLQQTRRPSMLSSMATSLKRGRNLV